MTVDVVAPLTLTSTGVGETLTLLAGCLCQQIADDDLPEPCFCGVVPGNEFPVKSKSCAKGNGIAYVKLVNSYPSVQVGVSYLQPSNCAVPLGIDIEVGLFRCYPLNRDGSNPSPEVMNDAAALQFADQRAMLRAITCCEWLDADSFVMGQYIPQGPAGGLLGGVWPISAQIMNP